MVDDTLDDVLLNRMSLGYSTGGHAAFGHPLLIAEGFMEGLNTLEFLTRNGADGPHGFRAELYVSAVRIPEPATLTLLALGGLGALFRRRRRR